MFENETAHLVPLKHYDHKRKKNHYLWFFCSTKKNKFSKMLLNIKPQSGLRSNTLK